MNWFGRRFKNHWFPTTVVCTHFNQDGKLWTTMNISNRLVGLATIVNLRAQGVNIGTSTNNYELALALNWIKNIVSQAYDLITSAWRNLLAANIIIPVENCYGHTELDLWLFIGHSWTGFQMIMSLYGSPMCESYSLTSIPKQQPICSYTKICLDDGFMPMQGFHFEMK